MPLAESSSRLATSWARLGHACARLGPQQLRVGGSKRKAPSRSLPLPSGSFHLPQWDFVACWADSAFPKGDSARHRGDSDPPGATRGADSAHAGPTRSAEWEHGRPTHSPHSDPPTRGLLDVRGRSDFSRFDPRPERPHFSNFGPPTERRSGGRGGGLRCAEPTYFSRVDAKRPTLAGLVPICARPTLVDLTLKYPTLVARVPPGGPSPLANYLWRGALAGSDSALAAARSCELPLPWPTRPRATYRARRHYTSFLCDAPS